MSKLHLKVVTPEKQIFDEEVDEVVVTTVDGEIGILPNHVNLMTEIKPGEMRVKNGGKTTFMATGPGLLQISNNTLSIMTDLAQEPADIDEKAVEEARKRAEVALEQKLTDEEYAQTLAILEKSLAQLQVKRRHRAR